MENAALGLSALALHIVIPSSFSNTHTSPSALFAFFDAANQALHHFREAIDDYLILITYKGGNFV